MLQEGKEGFISTDTILELVNLEILSTEELNDIKSKTGTYRIHIMMKQYEFDPQICARNLYRIIILPT